MVSIAYIHFKCNGLQSDVTTSQQHNENDDGEGIGTKVSEPYLS